MYDVRKSLPLVLILRFILLLSSIAVHGLINGNEVGVKGVKLLAVVGTSTSKGFLDNGVPEAIIIMISNLSNDRSKASSKTIPPHSAI